MKKLLLLAFIALSLSSCKEKDYVTLEIKLDGLEAADSTITLFGNQFTKKITINKNGVFKDTLKVPEASFYNIVVGEKGMIQTFMRNGFNLKIEADSKDITKTVKFSGKGAQNNTYLIERIVKVTEFANNQEALFKSDSATFYKGIQDFESKMTTLLENVKKADTTLVRYEKNGLMGYVSNLKETYKVNYEMLSKFGKGKPSPKFVNYENYKGGKTSLDDLKGKFVYIDVWATWCQPCVKEIPALKDLEKEYRGKNIAFVSISTDQKKDYDKWKAMVKEKGMEGIQLYFGDDMDFMQSYNITSIPRFILIDPNGNIVEANAPRPSETDIIKKLFADSGVK